MRGLAAGDFVVYEGRRQRPVVGFDSVDLQTLPADAEEMPWPLTQQDMANALGLTAVHVNRTVKHLRERDLLSLHSRSARLDARALHGIARPLLDIFEREEPAFGSKEV